MEKPKCVHLVVLMSNMSNGEQFIRRAYFQFAWQNLRTKLRIGDFYPPLENFDPQVDCPPFWRGTKVTIKLLNMTSHNYLHHIKLLAFVGIGIDLIVSVASIIFLWYYSCMPKIYEARKDKSGPFTCFKGFGKVKFIATEIILNFGLHLTDSITGKKLEKLMFLRFFGWRVLTGLFFFIFTIF